MTFVSVPASKKIMKKSPIIIIDFNLNSILNNVKRIFSFGRDEIERGRSSSSDLSILKENILKKNRKINTVKVDDESARLINF
jgi:hypothetical protein